MSTPSLFEIFFGPVSSPPENGTERRLAALMALDVVNYSALMGRNEEDTHTRIGRVLEQAAGCISDAHGRVFSFSGDGGDGGIPQCRRSHEMRPADPGGRLAA